MIPVALLFTIFVLIISACVASGKDGNDEQDIEKWIKQYDKKDRQKKGDSNE